MNKKEYQLLVIAGTYDGRELIQRLKKYNISILATVATQNGRELLANTNVDVITGRLDENGFKELIYYHNIKCVLDTSHPYADEVSRNVSNVCNRLNISYIRYLRPSEIVKGDNIIFVENAEQAAIKLNEISGNILLTTGSKDLNVFKERIDNYKQRLFIRILPISDSIKKCEDLGIPMSNIIAMSGYFTKDMNEQIIKYCKADILVTKDSGKVGGFDEKISAAQHLKLKIIIIQRPFEKSSNISTYDEAVINVIENIYTNISEGRNSNYV